MSELEKLLSQQGVGAATILAVVGPYLDRKIEATLVALEQEQPVLERLLNLRAELRVLRSFRREMMSKIESAKPRAGA